MKKKRRGLTMKIYKRMIRPMVNPPTLQGFSSKPFPLIGEDFWCNDDYEDIKISAWKKMIKDPMSTLFVDEKYEEIEFPQPKPIKMEDNNFVCFMFDIDKIDVATMCEYASSWTEVLPKGVSVAILPSLDVKISDEETVDIFINDYKQKVEERRWMLKNGVERN